MITKKAAGERGDDRAQIAMTRPRELLAR